mgnify:CR=1 FL=1
MKSHVIQPILYNNGVGCGVSLTLACFKFNAKWRLWQIRHSLEFFAIYLRLKYRNRFRAPSAPCQSVGCSSTSRPQSWSPWLPRGWCTPSCSDWWCGPPCGAPGQSAPYASKPAGPLTEPVRAALARRSLSTRPKPLPALHRLKMVVKLWPWPKLVPLLLRAEW